MIFETFTVNAALVCVSVFVALYIAIVAAARDRYVKDAAKPKNKELYRLLASRSQRNSRSIAIGASLSFFIHVGYSVAVTVLDAPLTGGAAIANWAQNLFGIATHITLLLVLLFAPSARDDWAKAYPGKKP